MQCKKKIPDTSKRSFGSNPGTGSIGPLYNVSKNAETVETSKTIAIILIRLSRTLYFPIAKIPTHTANKSTTVHSPRKSIPKKIFKKASSLQILQLLLQKTLMQ